MKWSARTRKWSRWRWIGEKSRTEEPQQTVDNKASDCRLIAAAVSPLESGGESGIRTHVRVSPKHAFQACAFSHSAISPANQGHTWCLVRSREHALERTNVWASMILSENGAT